MTYFSPNRDVMSVEVTNDPARPFGQPKLVRKALAGALTGDFTPDGQRSLVLRPLGQSEASELSAVVNRQAKLL